MTSPAQARALARRRTAREQLALDRNAPRVLLADQECPICANHDGFWTKEPGQPAQWEPCWAHEPLPPDIRKEPPPCPS